MIIPLSALVIVLFFWCIGKPAVHLQISNRDKMTPGLTLALNTLSGWFAFALLRIL
jgi:hypothetical protein